AARTATGRCRPSARGHKPPRLNPKSALPYDRKGHAMQFKRTVLTAALLAGLQCVCPWLASAQGYVVVEIGSPGVQSDASWLNEKGQVLGGDEAVGAFRWDAATGMVAFGGNFTGSAMNSAGKVAGGLEWQLT